MYSTGFSKKIMLVRLGLSFLHWFNSMYNNFRTHYERGCWTRNFNRNWKSTCELVLSFLNIQSTLQKNSTKPDQSDFKYQKLIKIIHQKPLFPSETKIFSHPNTPSTTTPLILSPKFWFFTILLLLSYFLSRWLDLKTFFHFFFLFSAIFSFTSFE